MENTSALNLNRGVDERLAVLSPSGDCCPDVKQGIAAFLAASSKAGFWLLV
jgi:hypothetical protein